MYRIELDKISDAVVNGTMLPFGRTGAIDRTRALQALHQSSGRAVPVSPVTEK